MSAPPFTPPDSTADVEVWAPTARSVTLLLDGRHDAETVEYALVKHPSAPGWWRPAPDSADALASEAAPARYRFRVDGGAPVPDPRAVRLPEGVHAAAALHRLDDSAWTDQDWAGLDLRGAVLYELHIGTFTPEGTFDSAIERLPHLVELGVDAVEVMPVNAFNGPYGWGYDGVAWYAVHEPYGGPDGFARFVDACHAHGLGVVLDVVYNHLGPSGNYLAEFGPYLTTGTNSWGSSLNLSEPDSDDVRGYIIGNALRWLRDFHVDGLRLDAVHALVDHRAVHLLEELAVATDTLASELGRPLTLIAESDLNDPRLIMPRTLGGYGLGAQWDDDIHHAIHAAVSGERQGYYADFGGLDGLAKVLTGGFFHDGTYSSFRRRHHGRPIPTETVRADALVAYTCNHDQVGNRAVGDRPSAYLDGGQLAAKAALVVLSPFTPMLFMGEEWAADTPFAFFTSHPEPELGEAVRTGRRSEFAEHGWDAADVPDPQDPETFRRSVLDWGETEDAGHARMMRFYRELIALRKSTDDLGRGDFGSVRCTFDADAGWFAMLRGSWAVICVLGTEEVSVPIAVEPELWWDDVTVDDNGVLSGGHNVIIGLLSGADQVG
ncbi:malto-oligosyltrehalose trehalohydrolase [Gordonia sp. HNM0687]|uniref:Malto-oligosyltrehalose trehalohydrolase n=1 Tax=Gordonia mangrovi TaxID=2665643 RepID=A0A6L7GML3_9ACTN|nr:malto-oligosyltrehalose trehalohydrolase [Gordonia mangrovi]MXP21150.1 malto-oligosyltrehalose trehalohydrolase [Gordonia mangrovi]UVF78314.1 malto-oligosyltrehalose trehalohydrolase [Gordonia mangrovi]